MDENRDLRQYLQSATRHTGDDIVEAYGLDDRVDGQAQHGESPSGRIRVNLLPEAGAGHANRSAHSQQR